MSTSNPVEKKVVKKKVVKKKVVKKKVVKKKVAKKKVVKKKVAKKSKTETHKDFRLFEFNIYDDVFNNDEDENEDDENNKDEDNDTTYHSDEDGNMKPQFKPRKDEKSFIIQMFGINEKRETCCLYVTGYKPFFYVKVPNQWKSKDKLGFITHIKKEVGEYYEDSILSSSYVEKKKLYGFDAGKLHKFLKIEFSNTRCMNKVKNLWYEYRKNKDDDEKRKKLIKGGYVYTSNYDVYKLQIYEANIPPLLRYFHIQEISPSGWISIPLTNGSKRIQSSKQVSRCDYEYVIKHNMLKPLPEKETRVPFKICSFDIEASSSHGDFPLAKKTYKKLVTNILDIWNHPEWNEIDRNTDEQKKEIYKMLLAAFGYKEYYNIDIVYPKKKYNQEKIIKKIIQLLKHETSKRTKKIKDEKKANDPYMMLLAGQDIKMKKEDHSNKIESNEKKMVVKRRKKKIDIEKGKPCFILETLKSKKTREEKINIIDELFCRYLPELEGDKVTFIGSTFLSYGSPKPYLNHCIVLNSCSEIKGAENTEIETYNNEKKVLLAWKDLILREDPDIIIGYNIFGFDYNFMFERSKELNCTRQFLELSRIKNEICSEKKWDKDNGVSNELSIAESKIVIASGEHELHYVKMTGRLQIDLYNYFRRDYNLTSYKLDYVSGHFIGDKVKNIEHDDASMTTKIYSKNLTGLENGAYIQFEESSHSVDIYHNKETKTYKFMVYDVNEKEGTFKLHSIERPNMNKKVRWCLAKDDVTPQDIFRMTNEGPNERAIIAKYCIQDCNLVHYLMNKIDVITGYIEMAKLCSVPMNFLVMRGQGIKLTSYIAKKCREKNTLLPVIEKPDNADGYEGAIVLPPKTDLYLDNPVACVDYSSLYPSSMISENISHDSKVWTKEFDLNGRLIRQTGEVNEKGDFIYDNLPQYKYVDILYDTYKYVRKTPSAAATKVLNGKKICRYAQFPNQEKACMPSILEELLAARKATRKQIPLQKDDFMKNILDKRQLSIKVTANSLYGQTGARTSSFYEVDVAASTTATGRKLLMYAKRTIEDAYGNVICDTKKYGKVLSKAEYIYGDTDSVFFTFNLHDLDGNPIRGKKALEITIELAQEAGEMATKFLKKPHDLEYEKTFMPFCLLSKKRYVGMLYETDPEKCYRKSMGIVLKRRDNAPIVKDVYGGIIDILMKEQDINKAIEFLKTSLQNLVGGKCPMEKLIITKSLRSNYKNPLQIAHKVLADRMGKRDPGNKPSSGDRIPFVYIQKKEKVKLQGDKIEHPDFIKENKLKIDYSFYITNQIMKPVQQLFALVLEQIPGFDRRRTRFENKLEVLEQQMDKEKFMKKRDDMRNREVKSLLFDKYIQKTLNAKNGLREITTMFQPI